MALTKVTGAGLGTVDSADLDGAVTINESSADVDFRVESNGLTNALFVDAGNDAVGINTTNASSGRRLHIEDSGTACGITLKDTAGSQFGITSDGGNLRFHSDTAGAERMMINASGEIFIGKTGEVSTQDGFHFKQTGECIIGRGSNDTIFVFQDINSSGATVGSISITSSNTAYNTSSDYRLKENVTTSWDATTRLKQLKPSRFNFKIDKDKTVDGFLAHEVSNIVPEAITGEKDAVDKDGNIKPQAIDHSKLVPLLVKTIQELEARIATLESK